MQKWKAFLATKSQKRAGLVSCVQSLDIMLWRYRLQAMLTHWRKQAEQKQTAYTLAYALLAKRRSELLFSCFSRWSSYVMAMLSEKTDDAFLFPRSARASALTPLLAISLARLSSTLIDWTQPPAKLAASSLCCYVSCHYHMCKGRGGGRGFCVEQS